MTDKRLTIGTLAASAKVNVETIRYYQRRGLLAKPEKPLGGIRSYRDADIHRVRFIKSAQGLGFTLEEIALLLKLEDGTHCAEAGMIAEQKLAEVRERVKNLKRIETALKGLVTQCHARRGEISCPLIATLHRLEDHK